MHEDRNLLCMSGKVEQHPADCTMQYYDVPCNNLQYYAVPCSTMVYHTMQYQCTTTNLPTY